MKSTISIEKDRIKLKGDNYRIIVPLDLKEEKPLLEPFDEYVDIWRLYQVIQSNEDSANPSKQGDLHFGTPISIGQNSKQNLMNGKLKSMNLELEIGK